MHPLRPLLLRASRSPWLRRRVPRLRVAQRAVRRFMPGEDVDSALAAAESLAADGLASVFTRLGENVTDATDAAEVTDHYVDVVGRIEACGVDGELSVKPTQLGLDVGGQGRGLELAAANLTRIVDAAHESDSFVWIDMESSAYVDATLELYERARGRRSNVGICLQAYLYRTARDLVRLLPIPPAIRLVKGAYAEPRDVAYAKKRRVDESFLRLGETLLADLTRGSALRVAFATHDVELLGRLRRRAAEMELPRHAYEVQMLYGIRVGEQKRLAREGGRVRVLISYGEAWYPWYVRRLAERPANLLFALKNLVR